jgi:hypothetical protein
VSLEVLEREWATVAIIERAYAETRLPVAVVTTEPELFEPLWARHGGRMVRETKLLVPAERGAYTHEIRGPGIWGPYPGLEGERRWSSTKPRVIDVAYCPDTDWRLDGRLDGTPILGYGSNWQVNLKTGAIRHYHLTMHDEANADLLRQYEKRKAPADPRQLDAGNNPASLMAASRLK